MAEQQYENTIELKDIYKSFGGVHALQGVSLTIRKGEVHALVGQNGAGKSTLMKILSGAYKKDKGEIIINGKEFVSNSLEETKKAGVGIIYQEFALAPDLTVAENIFINRMSLGKKKINWKKLYQEAQKILNELGFEIDAKERVGNLSVAYQQVVEIAKVLSEDINILVLDEPTAVLTPKEVDRLFVLLRQLQAKDVSIIYISHRLDEIFALSDRITIMKDGQVVETVDTNSITMNQTIEKMIGRSYDALFPERTPDENAEVVLKVENITNGIAVKNASFELHKGEILGIGGLVGAGKTETARAIFGADRGVSGDVYVNGKKVKITSPYDAIKNGIAYLPESRKEDGVLLSQSVRINTTLAALRKISKGGLINKKKEIADTNEMIEKLSVKTDGTEIHVGSLSGGNQQKVSLAKWIYSENKILILDEPTRGVDVGAKMEIYNLINDLTREGLSILLISSEVEELIGLSDRIMVLNRGNTSGFLTKAEATQTKVLNYSVGVID
ncbi:MAG: sugar ABC transporter ATP-binding protein [Lachnospiraceae bacterium]|jgi:ribose transport system ATP-binding protein